MTSQSSCAGVVTYNPDLDRLRQNLAGVSLQAERILVVDNGSSNIDGVELVCSKFKGLKVIRNPVNEGIARALNQLCHAARGAGAGWILLLDQDSVAPDGMLKTLESYRASNVGIVSPQIIDRGKLGQSVPRPDDETYMLKSAARKGAITSGSLINLSVYEHVGGFDDEMFIDYVDYDYNKRVMLRGFKIVRTGSTYLFHECGHMVPTLLWTPRRNQAGQWRIERFYSFGHSAERCYFKARNRIIYTKKYWKEPGFLEFAGIFQLPFTILLTLGFEGERKEKARAFARGIRDGISYRGSRAKRSLRPTQ